jgi:TetR/AcrR family transcriptional regulator, transcriptional repressor of aconitase
VATASERDSARRSEILEAAKLCFLRYGYGKTSLDDIAKAAGLSRPLLYRKFANKEAIFAALYDAVFLAQFEKAVPIASERGSKRALLLRMIEIVCVEPYALILQAPMAEEFWSACEAIIPEILIDHRKKWRALLAHVMAKELVETFDLSLDGLYADTPSVAVYRKRIGVLVNQFT